MFCRFCGNELPEGANFCPKCGKINEVEEATVNENAGAEIPETPVMDAAESVNVFEEEKSSLAGKILTFGILGLAFAASFCTLIHGTDFCTMYNTNLCAHAVWHNICPPCCAAFLAAPFFLLHTIVFSHLSAHSRTSSGGILFPVSKHCMIL